jgi:60 kDa SS-A/Ro ribonucleoprotein
MHSPATGFRGTATTKVNCIDVAALVSASILRKNENAEVIPFSDRVVPARLNPMDSIMTNAAKLAGLPSGGTNCSAPMALLNQKGAKGDLIIYVSDNQSWVDSSYHGATATMTEWNKFKARNPKAKMVCIDITPNTTTQAHDREDILNVGGFSDQVFDVIARFVELGNNKDLWVKTIDSVTL